MLCGSWTILFGLWITWGAKAGGVTVSAIAGTSGGENSTSGGALAA